MAAAAAGPTSPVPAPSTGDEDEWHDFSHASGWEEFVSGIEAALREWGLASTPSGSLDESPSRTPADDTTSPRFPQQPYGFGGTTDGAAAAGSADGGAADGGPTPSPVSVLVLDAAGSTGARHRTLQFQDETFRLSLFSTDAPDPPVTSMIEPHYPRPLADMLASDTSSDFPLRGHRLRRWFGVREFLVLSRAPTGAVLEAAVSPSLGSQLLSSLHIAAINCGTTCAAFVPVGRASAYTFDGFVTSAGCSARLSTAALPAVPASLSHLAGLIELFLTKLFPRDRGIVAPAILPMTVSCRFSWSVNQPDAIARLMRRRGASHPAYARTASGGSVDAEEDVEVDLDGLDPTLVWRLQTDGTSAAKDPAIAALQGKDGAPCWGPLGDPLASVQLFAVWPNQPVTRVTDNAVYSSLKADEAPEWMVKITWSAESDTTKPVTMQSVSFDSCPLSCMLATLASALHIGVTQLPEADPFVSLAPRLHSAPPANVVDVSGSRDSPAYSEGVATPPRRPSLDDDYDAFANMPAARGAALVGAALGSLTQSVVRILHSSGPSAAHTGHQIPNVTQRVSDVSAVHRTVDEMFSGTAPGQGHPHAQLHIKGAPPASLAALISFRISELSNVSDMALMWSLFVSKLRMRWDSAEPLPFMDAACTSPDLSTCLLHQKLQLLNICILKRRALRHAHAAASSPTVAGQQASDTPQHGADWDAELDLELGGDDEDQGEATAAASEPVHPEGVSLEVDDPWQDELDLNLEPDQGNAAAQQEEAALERLEEGGSGDTSDDTSSETSDEFFDVQPAADADGDEGDDGGLQLGVPLGEAPAPASAGEPAPAVVPAAAPPAGAETPDPLAGQRQGAASRIAGMALLASGAPMFAPITQSDVMMTEDALAERQLVFARLGSSTEASHMRQLLQSQALRSDMSAFKAANPGAFLEDFIRWHSPKDWSADPEQPHGRLSARMSGADNVWQRAWNASPAVPLAEQPSQFHASVEAERILNFLETITATQLLPQVIAAWIPSAHHVLHHTSPVLQHHPVLRNLLNASHQSAKRLCQEVGDAVIDRLLSVAPVIRSQADGDLHSQAAAAAQEVSKIAVDSMLTHCNALVQYYAKAEMLLAHAVSLSHLFPEHPELVRALVVDNQVAVIQNPEQRLSVRRLFDARSDGSLPLPLAKEFILRSTVPRVVSSAAVARSTPHRLYAFLSASDFRVATAVAELEF